MPETANQRTSMERYPPSGISILIVGGGIAGLGFAIEAYRKGHDVRLVERRFNFHDRGALIGLPAPALDLLQQWPGFMERLIPHTMKPVCRVHKSDLTFIGEFPVANSKHPSLPMSRPALHNLLLVYAQELGIDIELDRTVTSYFENKDYGGVIFEDGSRKTADVVVAADGVNSKAWELVGGHKQDVVSSGFACHLVTYPAGPAMENPVIRKGFDGLESGVFMNFGKGAHFVIGKNKDVITCVIGHRDDSDADSEWGQTVPSESALKYIDNWAPFFKEIVKAAPDGHMLRWRLAWRDPQPDYVSPNGRIVQIGDAAHPFLPTSGSGAGMALEDSSSLASCLQLAGRSNVPLGLRVHNLFRYERACCAQRSGFKNREKFHDPDWDSEATAQSMATFSGEWLSSHRVEKYVYDNFGNAVNHILMGRPFKNTNSVPGYNFRPWTVKEFLDAADEGRKIVDEGDWY